MRSRAIRRASTGLLVAVALPAALLAGMKIDVLYDHAADFSSFRTYRWVTTPLNETPEAQLLDKRVKAASDAELAERGLTRVEPDQEADLLATYHVGTEENLLIEGVRFELAPHVVWTGADPVGVTHRYEIGTLVLDFADAGTEKIVWSGLVQARARTLQQLREKVEKAVVKVLREFPPK